MEVPKENNKLIFCKECKHYKGEIGFDVRYPMGVGRNWQYVCGLYSKSVFEVNPKNDCKDFESKPPPLSFFKKLKFWKRKPKK